MSNLALQERRLRNQHKSDLEKLQALQTERLEKQKKHSEIPARMLQAIRTMFNSRKFFGRFDPADFGFEFSVAEIEHCHEVMDAAQRRGDTIPNVVDLLSTFRNEQKTAQAA